jgi:ribosomal protein S27AE
MKLDWKNLKDNRCPQCGNAIVRDSIEDYSCVRCGFFCKKKRADEIIFDIEHRMDEDKTADEFMLSKGVIPEKLRSYPQPRR